MKYMIRMVIVLLAVFIAASCDVNQPYEETEVSEPDSVDIRVEVLDHDTDERIKSAEILFDSTVVSSDGLFTETREERDVDINVLARADGYQEMSEPRVINTLSDVSISIRLKQIKESEPQPPIARFTFNTDETLTASFDGSESSDPDGSNDDLTYEWEFGDGETGSGATPDHTYDEAGSYDVTLTVTDADGLTGAETHTVSVGTDNQKPEPDFEVAEKNDLKVTFENLSSDPDGDELTYLWQFGDGKTSKDENPSHEYESAGEYDVTLTATDPDGASDNITKTVTVTKPQSPTASFTSEVNELTVSYDGSNSSDPDGQIVEYRWDFENDGTIDEITSSPTTEHTFDSEGSYTTRLVVQDDDDLTGETTGEVKPQRGNQPPEVKFIVDSKDELTVHFENQSSDPDGDKLSYNWNFGDGETSDDKHPSHTYSDPGDYKVTLTGTDPDGADDTYKKTVTVSLSPPPSCPLTSNDGQVITFSDNRIVANGSKSAARTQAANVNLDSGEYKVTLYGYDNHEDRPNQNQSQESYYVSLRDGSHEVAKSNELGDLPDGTELGERTTTTNVTVSKAVDNVVGIHAAYPSSEHNSLNAECAAFKRTGDLQQSEAYEHEITIDASDKIWVSDHQNRQQDQLLDFGEVRPIMTDKDPIGTVEMTVRMKLDDDQPEHSYAEIIFDDGSKIETPIFSDQSDVSGWTNVTVEIPADEFAGQAKELAEVIVFHGDQRDDSKPSGEDDVIFATTSDNGKVWFKWRIPVTGQSKIAGSRKFDSYVKIN